MPLDSGLLAAALTAVVGCPVITHAEYLRQLSNNEIQPLDTEAFHKSVLVAPAPQPPTQPAPPQAQPAPTSTSADAPTQQKRSLSFLLRKTATSDEIIGQSQPSSSQQPEAALARLSLLDGSDAGTTQKAVTPQLVSGSTSATPSTTVFVKTLSGRIVTNSVSLNDTVADFKQQLADKVDVLPEQQRLVYAGKELQDNLTLANHDIQHESTIQLALQIRGNKLKTMYLPADFLDPIYDCDFTHINDGSRSFSRGGEKYVRPCGWARYALKVNGKYGADGWLGCSNGPGEWPVSYHGNRKTNTDSFAEVGFKKARGVNFPYGRGIYSTPSHAVAESYASEFTYLGKRYKVMFQNRVNPTNLEKIPNMDFWISPADADIRPYGLCIKQV